MNHRVFWACVIAVGVLLAGCIKSQYESLTPETFPPTASGSIEVFLTKSPSRDYTEIGIVEVEGPRLSTYSGLLDALKKKAALVGAQGLIVQSQNERVTGAIKTGPYSSVPIRRKVLTAVAIRWKN